MLDERLCLLDLAVDRRSPADLYRTAALVALDRFADQWLAQASGLRGEFSRPPGRLPGVAPIRQRP